MKRLRIAVAEDEWLLAEDLRVQLEALGHTVVEIARTGEELVSAVARARPDLALVDIKLARGSDGLAAAQEVQERLGVPAIAVTGHLTPEEAREAGLLGLVQKPITPTKLRAMLGRAARRIDGGGTG